jgi:hypothetical protein
MFLKISLFFVVFVCSVAQASLCDKVADHLQEGDLVFLDMDSVIFEQVAIATQTWTSHVGVAVYDEGWYVVESALIFSRQTPLCSYLKRTQDQRFAIRRLKRDLTASQLAELKDYLSAQMGVLYDTGFNYDSERLFCSKLVYEAFQTIGIEVGQIKTLRDLFNENPEGSLTFWKWWFLGSIPWERRTITPKDQLIDSDFFTVLSSEVE